MGNSKEGTCELDLCGVPDKSVAFGSFQLTDVPFAVPSSTVVVMLSGHSFTVGRVVSTVVSGITIYN